MADFVNRSEELDRLRALYESDDAELAVIFGRRRLGKTALVKQSLTQEDNAIVYQAKQKTSALQLQQFIETAAESSRLNERWIYLLCNYYHLIAREPRRLRVE
ncbi:ATP-binding protein [Halomontanus rarus]|uniref:ATP-binding protein n=1 Tax=Halomontanus rarus TaxID=3034020 RepID=UPI001A99DC99